MMHIVLETPMVEYSNVARIWPTAKQFPLPLLGNHFAPCHIFHSYLALRTSLELDSYYTRAVLWELKVNHLQTWAAHLSRLSCKSRWCKALLFATLKKMMQATVDAKWTSVETRLTFRSTSTDHFTVTDPASTWQVSLNMFLKSADHIVSNEHHSTSAICDGAGKTRMQLECEAWI